MNAEDRAVIRYQKAAKKVTDILDNLCTNEDDLWGMCEPDFGMELTSIKHEGVTYYVTARR